MMEKANLSKLCAVRTSSARCLFAATALLLASAPAVAYVGPGAGLSLAGAVWGLVVAVVAAVGFIVLWPIRRYFKRRKAGHISEVEHDAQPEAEVNAAFVEGGTSTAKAHGMNEEPRSATGRIS